MTLLDTGPIVAFLDPSDSAHEWCSKEFKNVIQPLITTLPVIAEAMHFLQKSGKMHKLINFISDPNIMVVGVVDEHLERILDLMDQYSDIEIDLADATLIAIAEARGIQTIFTLDIRDFSIYRIRKGYKSVPFYIHGGGKFDQSIPQLTDEDGLDFEQIEHSSDHLDRLFEESGISRIEHISLASTPHGDQRPFDSEGEPLDSGLESDGMLQSRVSEE